MKKIGEMYERVVERRNSKKMARKSLMEYPLNMGGVGREVRGGSGGGMAVQRWFDRGFGMMLGYNHEEGARLFGLAVEAASDNDVKCAMAHWGLACCLIGNYNNPGGLGEADARKSCVAASEAIAFNAKVPGQEEMQKLEAGLVNALTARLDYEDDADIGRRKYATAMQKLLGDFPDDTLVAAVCAEALMMLSPWKLWTSRQKGPIAPAIPETPILVEILEKALKKDPTCPYLCHLYCHAMELSPTPEAALPAANALRTRVPDQGHLVHMASHIDMWVGQYKEAIDANAKGVAVDDQYVAMEGGQKLNFYAFYRFHNMHFLVWAAMFDGQFALAEKTARRISADLDKEAVTFMLGGQVPMGMVFLEAFAMTIWHVLVRFGKWQQIIAEPLPDAELYPSCVAMAHYAKGIAHAAIGNIPEAEKHQAEFDKAHANPALDVRVMHNNPIANRKGEEGPTGTMQVAEAMLAGEIAYRKGNYDVAFKTLKKATALEDSLAYDEPTGWMMPTRHALGALLAEQGRHEEAIAAFNEDLALFKENLWALRGLATCYRATGDADALASVEARLGRAEGRADEKGPAVKACYCANKSVKMSAQVA